jgi:hypothetical protein
MSRAVPVRPPTEGSRQLASSNHRVRETRRGSFIVPIVSAGPNEYLLTGNRGTLRNDGSAIRKFLMPGAIYVLVPSTKQEATFEFTQETKDGIPLRFKGIIIYRITEPIAAAQLFNFSDDAGVEEIDTLLTHVCLGELRHAVSHMTMTECIEQRKTTLSAVAQTALESTIHRADSPSNDWGITVEVAQLAQVFIVDTQLRQQLEAEVRNEIKLKSDQSDLRTKEEASLAEMASKDRLDEQRLAGDRESLRRQEELEMAQLARERRMQTESVATERQRLELEQDRFRAAMEAETDRVNTEAPVRLLRAARESEALREELETRRLENEVKAFDVERDLLLPRAQQELRRQMLPLEQTPQIVEAASRVLQGTNLSIYGQNAEILGQLAPLFDLIRNALQQTTQSTDGGAVRASDTLVKG